MTFKYGDEVRTLRGDRFRKWSARREKLIVLSAGKDWRHYATVICQGEDGRQSRFLEKNLVSYE